MREFEADSSATKTYEDGLREAWDLARRLVVSKNHGGFTYEDMEYIFKTHCVSDIFMNFTPQKAADCITLWEDRQEIRVGDVLKAQITGKEVIVSRTKSKNEKKVFVIYPDGSCGECDKDSFIKTGRTIDIVGLLAQIGGGENV